jgi:hypothetical protein
MATLVERVQELADVSYTSVTQEDYVVDWLKAGLLALIRLIPPKVQWNYASEIVDADGSTGASLDGALLLGAAKSGRVAVQWPLERKGELSDTDSLYEASSFSPRFYIERNRVYVLPGGGTVYIITVPNITASTSNIDSLPEQFGEIACLYAAMRVLLNAMQDLGISLSAEAISVAQTTFSGVIADPNFEALVPVAPTIDSVQDVGSSPSIDDELLNPDYAAAGQAGPIADVDTTPSASVDGTINETTSTASTAGDVGDATTGKTADETAATATSASGSTVTEVTDASTVSIASAGSVAIPSAPVPPTIILAQSDSLWDFGWADAGEAFNTLPSDITIPTLDIGYPSISSAAITATLTATPPNPADFDFNVNAVSGAVIPLVQIDALPAGPEYNTGTPNTPIGAPAGTLTAGGPFTTALADMWEVRDDDDDSEMSSEVIKMFQQMMDLYQKQLFDNINVFNAKNADFQREVDRILKQAELNLQANIQQAQLDYGVSRDNAYEQARVNAQVYAEQARGYAAQVEAYRAQVNAEVQVFVAEHIQGHLQAWLREADSKVQKFQGEVASLQADQQKDLSVFQARVARETEKQRNILQDTIAYNQSNIAVFNAEVQKYQTDLNIAFQEVQLEQARLQTEAELNTRIALENLGKDLQRQIETARNTTQASITTSQVASNVDVSVMQADLQGKIAELETDVQLSIQNMQKDLQKALQDAQLATQASISDMQAAMGFRGQKLGLDLQGKIAVMQAKTQEALESMRKDLELAVSNAQAVTQASIASLQADTSIKGTRIQSDLQAAITTAQINSQEAVANMQKELQRVVENAGLDLQAEIVRVQIDAQIKNALINAFSAARIAEATTIIQSEIPVIQAQLQADLGVLQANVQYNAQKMTELHQRYQFLQGLYMTELQQWLGQFGGKE